MNCANCGHGSLVRSNFRLSKSRVAYCNSKYRPECELARQRNDNGIHEGELLDEEGTQRGHSEGSTGDSLPTER